MTTTAATARAAAPPSTPPRSQAVRFLGDERTYWRILVRGAVLLVPTLGIYRFWLATDVRRFLWTHTDIAGHTLEYTGTAAELLLGFLVAMAILIPLYVGVFFLVLELGLPGPLAVLGGFILLGLLGYFAVYRARRYRLTRTVYRGIRFHQTGSAARFAVRALGWWLVTVATLGLTYPWAQASLERYKMEHTHYGDMACYFEGSTLRLFLRGFLMWLVVMGPLVYALATVVQSVNWPALSEAMSGGIDEFIGRMEGSSPELAGALASAMIAAAWAAVAAALLYPVFQAMTLRWWSSGLRFGEIALRSRLRTAQVYAVYLRFAYYAVVFVVIAGIIGAAELSVVAALGGPERMSVPMQTAVTAILVGTYAIIALAFSTIYQATLKLPLWRLGMESLDMSNLAALERVRAVGRASSAIGEGLADALNVGRI